MGRPRYGMIRFAEQHGSIHLVKLPTASNFADITTKPLKNASPPFNSSRL